MKNLYCGTFLVLLLALTSCQPPQQGLDAEDERNPYFRKGAKLAADGNFHGAISEYESALRANPKVQKAYLEIGILYADKLNDPVGAAYHFQKYLDARPEAPDLAQVQTYLEKAKIDFALTLPNSSTQNAQEFAQISKENIELKQALASVQETVARKEEEIARIKSGGPATGPATFVVSKPSVAPLTPSGAPPSITPLPVTSTAANNAGTPGAANTAKTTPAPSKIPVAVPVTSSGNSKTHVIQAGDNLWKIAKQYYPDDINGGIEKIKAANPQTASNAQNLKLGQKLVIP